MIENPFGPGLVAMMFAYVLVMIFVIATNPVLGIVCAIPLALLFGFIAYHVDRLL